MQPQAWVKEVLQEIAILHKRGPYKDLWELREEYRVPQEEPHE